MPELIVAGAAGGAALLAWWLASRERADRQPVPVPVRARQRTGGPRRR